MSIWDMAIFYCRSNHTLWILMSPWSRAPLWTTQSSHQVMIAWTTKRALVAIMWIFNITDGGPCYRWYLFCKQSSCRIEPWILPDKDSWIYSAFESHHFRFRVPSEMWEERICIITQLFIQDDGSFDYGASNCLSAILACWNWIAAFPFRVIRKGVKLEYHWQLM